MSTNPFKPPESRVKDKPPEPGSPLRAILTGLAIDIGGSLVISIVLGVIYAITLSHSGMTEEQVDDAMRNIPPTSLVEILGTVLGSLCSVAGGYACARIVQRDEYRVCGVMAALSGFLGLLLSDGRETPADMLLLYTVTTVACVMLGAKYGRGHNRRALAPPPRAEDPPR